MVLLGASNFAANASYKIKIMSNQGCDIILLTQHTRHEKDETTMEKEWWRKRERIKNCEG